MILALIEDFMAALPLLVIFCLVIIFSSYSFIRDRKGDEIYEKWEPTYLTIQENIYWLKWYRY